MGKVFGDKDSIKQQLGDRAKYIILSGTNSIERKGKISCLSPTHNDVDPSMSWYKDGNCFRCHACDYKIDIYEYYTQYERKSFTEAVEEVARLTGNIDYSSKLNVAPKVKYNKPNIKMVELSANGIEYMGKRKITKETLEAWKVKETIYNNEPNYVFQYFLDGQLEYVSYRVQHKANQSSEKGGCEKNTRSILWGMDHIDKTKPIIITEGQIDAMSIYQSGYKNVVSLPAGANNMKWIDHCWEWLQDCQEFILWKDNDQAGNKCEEAIKSRLKNVKVIYSEDCKDANELLYHKGKDAVMEIVNEGLKQKVKGIIDVSEIEYNKKTSISNGIETGFIEYDRHVKDWKEQEITVIFGRDNEGKTTVISQIIAHNLQRKVKTFLYSGEMSRYKIQNWMYRQLIGTNTDHLEIVRTKYGEDIEIKDSVIKKIKEWHRDTFYLFDSSEYEILKDMSKFFDVMGIAATRYGVKLFVIDNLMSALEENAESLNSDQANFVQYCKNFAIKFNVHVVLLAHPNKEKQEINNGIGNLTKKDISGTKNISNKADNIISVERNWDETENKDCDLILTSQKDRESGQRKIIKYNFSRKTLRFYNSCTKESVVYGWDKSGTERMEQEQAIYAQSDIGEWLSN